MNDNINKNVVILPPFKRFCMTIGELPTSYLETMTYYEMLVWFCNYLGKTVIPAINENAAAVSELQTLFVELQTYVNTYFDNLDVQEEVNNKLDAMALDGTLDNIINQEIFGELSAKVDETYANLNLYNTKVHSIYGGDNNGNVQVIENEDHNTIIDFGLEAGIPTVMNYLLNKNITTFKYAIITHYHIDHVANVNGIKTMVNNANFDFSGCTFILPTITWSNFTEDMSTYEGYESDLISFLTSKNINIQYITGDTEIVFDQNNKLNITNGSYTSGYYATNDLNNFSLVTMLTSQNKKCLFTGDIGEYGQSQIYSKIDRADLFTVPHHGVDATGNKAFLERIHPEVAIIMNTTDIYPNREMFDYLIAINSRLFCSNYSHNVVVSIENGNFNVVSDYGEYNDIYENNIRDNADFNDFTRTGKYYLSRTDIFDNLVNKPIAQQGTLIVEEITASTILQTYIANTTVPVIYTRILRGGTWSAWTQSDLNNKPMAVAVASSQYSLTTSSARVPLQSFEYSKNIENNELELVDTNTNVKINDTRYSQTCKLSAQLVINEGLQAGDMITLAIFVGSTNIKQVRAYANGDCISLNISEFLYFLPVNSKVSIQARNVTAARGKTMANQTYLKIEYV